MTTIPRPLVPGYLRRAVVRLVDAVCAPLDRALCRWSNETGEDA